MLERTISRKVVEWLYGHGIIERSESNIYVYAYELLISSTISIFLILIASCVCGNIWYSLAFLLGFIPLRIYLGGYHASSHFNCYLAFLSVFLASVVLSYQIVATYGFRLITTCLLFIIAFLYAPVEAKNKRLPTEKKRKYRHISICLTGFDVILAAIDILPLSRFITIYYFSKWAYTKLGLPKPLRFRSIKPNSSSSRSNFVALLSAQHNDLLTSSIVKMMNTRFCSSSQPFLADRLIRSSRIP